NDDMWLNLFRGFQGIGGAAMMSLSLTIVTTAFPAKQRGMALGIWSSAVGLAVSTGPLIGGWLVDNLGWRSIFLVNIPVGLLAMLCGWWLIQDNERATEERLDFLGLISSAVLIFSTVFALMQKEQHPSYTWLNWRIVSLLGLAFLALICFIVIERRSKEPLVDLSVFKSPTFVGANIAAFTLGAGLYGGFTYLSVLLQNYMGYSAFETGLKLLVISIFTLILGPLTGFIASKIGNRWLITGALLIGASGVIDIYFRIQTPFKWLYLLPGFILLGISNALVNPPISTAAMNAVESRNVGMASGLLNVFRQVGISFGVVMLGISVTNGYNSSLNHALSRLTQVPTAIKLQLTTLLHHAGPFAGQQIFDSKQARMYQQLPLFQQLHQNVFNAFDHGMKNALVLIAVLLVIGAISAIVLIRDRHTD
ncbi:MAG TPA: MFS transporter, partial [Lactobacillus sp.]|nr:MFS transporter [Lactobacillus sp.]